MNPTPAWITHDACTRHRMGDAHPESPQRLRSITAHLRSRGWLDRFRHFEAPVATRESLERAHGAAHVDEVLRHRDIGPRLVAVDGDTAYGEHTVEAALRAAGANVLGVDLLLDGRTRFAFCAVRPPGHHAEHARAMGFCFFNNVAVAAGHALARGIERVAILDFDLHYGNGTADIFKDDPRVVMLSTYQHPLYPYWHGLPLVDTLIDVPLRARSDGAVFRDAVRERWLPALRHQQPQLILVSAGFDAHADDPLGDLRLVEDDFRWIGAAIRDAAAASAGHRVLATLEGGYDVDALTRSVEAFIEPFFESIASG